MTAATQTVREIALEQPTSIRVFEEFGIDYCCGGRKPLAEACAMQDLAVDAVLAALEAATAVSATPAQDWSRAPLAHICAHIVSTHHVYVTRELPRLALLADKVVNRHGAHRPELLLIQSTLESLDEELTRHLAKEEAILFPYVAELERALLNGSSRPHGCFATVANPIAMMTQEHDAAGVHVARIRQLSSNFTTPEDACPTYLAFYDGLREFQQDLHQHIHIENNILFPRAIELEASAS